MRQQETGVYLLLWVDHHDEAYQWAARKRCEVNPKTATKLKTERIFFILNLRFLQ